MTEDTELQHIIQRIKAMTLDDKNELQERHFDKFGVTVVTVQFDRPSSTFALLNGRSDKKFAFDDLDLLAIDVYEALNEFKEIF